MDNKIRKTLRDINKTRLNLIKRAAKSGLYENFGDREQRSLWDKHWEVLQSYSIDTQPARVAFQQFRSWCQTYTPNK